MSRRVRGSRLFLLAFSLLIFAINAQGFDVLPEYQTLSELEQESFDRPDAIDSEYQSDFLTYLLPPEWETFWLASPQVFDLTLGSLSGTQFLYNTRLKLRQDLTDRLQFRLINFLQRDYEVDTSHQVIELNWRIAPQWLIGAYGEPSLYKRENDVGLSAIFEPGPGEEIRIFNTWVDITRQTRSDRPDRFDADLRPMSTGISGQHLRRREPVSSSSFFTYTIRHDHLTRWLFPVEELQYEYRKSLAQTFARWRLGEDRYMSFRLQYDRKQESNAPSSVSSTVTPEAWTTTRWQTLGTYEFPLDSDGWKLQPGVGWFHRQWRRNNDVITHRNLLPHIWLEVPVRRGPIYDFMRVGYEATFFEASGPLEFRGFDPKDEAVEHRLNFRYEFHFRTGAVLALQVTADGDELGTGRTFEGGNGQFRVAF